MNFDQNIRRQLVRVALAVTAILLLVRVADITASEVNWTAKDYAAAALLLGGAGVSFVAASRNIADSRVKRRLAIGILTIVALAWVMLAVEFDGFSA